MKRIYIAVSLIIITLILSIAEFVIVNKNYKYYSTQLDNALKYIQSDDYTSAKDICDTICTKWEKSQKNLEIFLVHTSLNSLTDNIYELQDLAKDKNKAKFIQLCTKTKRQLLFMKKSELPLFENIM